MITLSAGNHAQGVALAAHEAGVHAVVMMPAGAVRSKVDACRGYGAEVILFGEHVGETWARMEEVQAERGLTFVPPFDDPWIIAGQGTVGLEILDDLPDVDVVVAGIGGGALCTGTRGRDQGNAARRARLRRRAGPIQRPVAGPGDAARSCRSSRSRSRTAWARRSPGSGRWPWPGATWTASCCIDDATILAGMRFALERMKQLVEPAGAAALARGALRPGADPRRRAGLRRVQRRQRGAGPAGRIAGGARRRSRCAAGGRRRGRSAPGSVDAQLVEPIVVDAEVVAELVQDRDPDLFARARRRPGSPPSGRSGRA